MKLQLILISLLILSLSGMEREQVKILMAGDSTMPTSHYSKAGVIRSQGNSLKRSTVKEAGDNCFLS